jgi:hypothetical protein
LTFVDAEATLALEVRRLLPPGQDPTAGPAPMAVDLYVTTGSVRARVGSDPPLDLQAPTRRALVGSGIQPPGDFPSWVTSEALSDADDRAVDALDPLLPQDQFVGVTLKELANDRRVELRSLAIRSATYLGNFDPCTEALNEKDEKNLWPKYVAELLAAVARSPETAVRVKTSLTKQRGADGEAMFRMLWGYSTDDLKSGAAAQLVDGLDHDSLDYRVLSIVTLQNIAGPANYGYYPADLAKKRAPAVKRWRERLRGGKIVPPTEQTEP